MATLSVTECSKRYGIPETNIRYWMDNNSIPYSLELRGERQVKVILEEDMEQFLASRDDLRHYSSRTVEDERFDRGLSLAQYYTTEIEKRDKRIEELQRQVVVLEQEKGAQAGTIGELQGENLQLKERLEEQKKHAEVLMQEKLTLVAEKDQRIADKDRQLEQQGQMMQVWQRLQTETAVAKDSSRPWWKRLLSK